MSTRDSAAEQEESPGTDVEEGAGFRLRGRCYLITYRDHLEKETLAKFLGCFSRTANMDMCVIAHESADKENPYLHTHAVVKYRKALDVKGAQQLDYQGDHPRIKALTGENQWNDALRYIAREDPAVKEEMGLAETQRTAKTSTVESDILTVIAQRKPSVYWYWGPMGSGKSLNVMIHYGQSVYFKHPDGYSNYSTGSPSTLWPGYRGHEVVVIDNFSPVSWDSDCLLELLAGRISQVNVGDRYEQLTVQLVIITSRYHYSRLPYEERLVRKLSALVDCDREFPITCHCKLCIDYGVLLAMYPHG